MDLSSIFAAHALAIGAGALIALPVALAAALARARARVEDRARRAAAENEALRDEVWRLKEAAAARDRAEAASEAKSRFLATMSHEIRTPISGIIGMADLMLLVKTSLTPESASYVEAIRSSGHALIALIDEILDLSKIEAGRFDLAVEPVDLRRLVEGVVELLAPKAQSKGLEIAASISADAPRFVLADAMRLRQVLTNLAGNAIKFTGRGGVCVSIGRGRRRGAALRGHRHRPRRADGSARRHLRGFRAGRRLERPPLRGRGARPRHLAPARRPDGRRADATRTTRAAARSSPSPSACRKARPIPPAERPTSRRWRLRDGGR